MLRRYWQGEIYSKFNELIDVDFPERETKEEALRDAEARAEGGELPEACEWIEYDDGLIRNSGNTFNGK